MYMTFSHSSTCFETYSVSYVDINGGHTEPICAVMVDERMVWMTFLFVKGFFVELCHHQIRYLYVRMCIRPACVWACVRAQHLEMRCRYSEVEWKIKYIYCLNCPVIVMRSFIINDRFILNNNGLCWDFLFICLNQPEWMPLTVHLTHSLHRL